ncbi:hypothetical protein Tco_0792013 [Tanacetum coccineum]
MSFQAMAPLWDLRTLRRACLFLTFKSLAIMTMQRVFTFLQMRIKMGWHSLSSPREKQYVPPQDPDNWINSEKFGSSTKARMNLLLQIKENHVPERIEIVLTICMRILNWRKPGVEFDLRPSSAVSFDKRKDLPHKLHKNFVLNRFYGAKAWGLVLSCRQIMPETMSLSSATSDENAWWKSCTHLATTLVSWLYVLRLALDDFLNILEALLSKELPPQQSQRILIN